MRSLACLAVVALVACKAPAPAELEHREPRIAVKVSAASPAVLPIAVSPNGRYLVDQAGSPFRLQIDAAWVTVAHASDADVTTYLQSIKPLGFTGFILMNIVHAGGPGWPNLNEPADFYKNQPFLTPNELDTPNPEYFARVKKTIDQALELGLVVEFFHTYLGSDGGNDGWETVITNAHNDDTVCFNWGVYLANTFTQPNIIWMHGGDHQLSGTALSRFQRIVAGIQSVSRNRIAGAEWQSPDSIITDQTGFTYGTNPATSDMQLNSFYGAGPKVSGRSFETADRSWSNSPPLPAEIQEPAYEDAWYAPAIATREKVRATYHWAITAGAIAGGTVGAKNRWDWRVDQKPLETLSTSAVTQDAVTAFAFYQSLPWHLMVPSGTGTARAGRALVVSGGGTGDTTITASMTSNGTHLIAYCPPSGTDARTFAVDLRSMSGSSRGRFWNPASGAYTNISSGYSLPNTAAAQSFTTPGNNGAQANDWMLVLDTEGAGSSGTGGAPAAGGTAAMNGGAAQGSAGSGGTVAGGGRTMTSSGGRAGSASRPVGTGGSGSEEAAAGSGDNPSPTMPSAGTASGARAAGGSASSAGRTGGTGTSKAGAEAAASGGTVSEPRSLDAKRSGDGCSVQGNAQGSWFDLWSYGALALLAFRRRKA